MQLAGHGVCRCNDVRVHSHFSPRRLHVLQGKEKESAARIKRFMTIMDSMTDKELDCPNPKVLEEPSRMLRLARGSGSHPAYVGELLGKLLRACAACVLCMQHPLAM